MHSSMNIGFSVQNNNDAYLDSVDAFQQTSLSSELGIAAFHIQRELLMNMPSSSSNFLPMIAREVLEARDFKPYQSNGLRLWDREGLLGGAGGASSSSTNTAKDHINSLLEKVANLKNSISQAEKELQNARNAAEAAHSAGNSDRARLLHNGMGGRTTAIRRWKEQLKIAQAEVKLFQDPDWTKSTQ